MIRTHRAFPAPRITAFLALLTLAFLLAVAAPAGAEEATTATTTPSTVHYTKESTAAYEQQLAAGQIQSVIINKRVGSLRITLKNGEHVLIHYAAHQEPTIYAALIAKGVAVTILKPAAAAAEASKAPVKHKLRYIAGGILLVVIIVVGTVLLVDRKRKAAAE